MSALPPKADICRKIAVSLGFRVAGVVRKDCRQCDVARCAPCSSAVSLAVLDQPVVTFAKRFPPCSAPAATSHIMHKQTDGDRNLLFNLNGPFDFQRNYSMPNLARSSRIP